MAGYYDFAYKKKMGAPEDSYLYSSSAEMSQPQSYLGGQHAAQGMQAKDVADLGISGGAGMAMGGPAAAGIAVGGQFLSNYLSQKAADERAKRDRAAQIEQNYTQNQNQGFNTMMEAFRGALR